MKRELVVNAGVRERELCPMSACIDIGEDRIKGLSLKDGDVEVPCQWSVCENSVTVSWILDKLGIHQSKTYELSTNAAGTKRKAVSLTQVPGKQVKVRVGGELFTAYCFGGDIVRPYLYPIVGPYGKEVTRQLAQPGQPLDHHHHRSFWVAHGSVNGVDNWSEEEGHGRTVHRSFEALESGPVYGLIVAKSDWVNNQGAKVLEETRSLKFYNLPRSTRIVDMDVALTATEGDVLFGDTKEGGIASVRVATSMEVRNTGKIENSYGGVNESETWGRRAPWCDYSGVVGRDTIGLALFDSPQSFRYPTYWHVRNYGLMTANPFGLSSFLRGPKGTGDHTLKHGESLNFRYRMYVHPGDAAQGKVRDKYHDFVNPPEVEVR